MTQVTWKDRDITGLVTLVTVEQSLSAAGREARITAIYAPGDSRFTLLNPGCGDAVAVTAEGKQLFSGQVERVQWDTDSLLLTMVCLERSSLLAKNEVYRAFSGTAKEIALSLCRLCGLTAGELWDKPGTLWIPPSCGRTLFSILREAYGEQCITESRENALTVRQAGVSRYALRCGDALSLESAHSCDQAVTGASVISAGGQRLASAERPQWEAAWGRRRRVYALTGSQSRASAQAEAHLTGPSYSGQLVLPGDPAIRCGALVTPDKGDYGLGRQYLINWVLHRLEAGVFTTTIGMVNAS